VNDELVVAQLFRQLQRLPAYPRGIGSVERNRRSTGVGDLC
jgi:hypothetical protein